MEYFDRDGKPITERRWEALKSNKEYWELAETLMRGHLIRTTWVGKGEAFRDGKPLIFRTVDYRYVPNQLHDITWHTSEVCAWKHHAEVVKACCHEKAVIAWTHS